VRPKELSVDVRFYFSDHLGRVSTFGARHLDRSRYSISAHSDTILIGVRDDVSEEDRVLWCAGFPSQNMKYGNAIRRLSDT
jgi:hypothetical protein